MLNVKTILSKEGLDQLRKSPDLLMRRMHQGFTEWLNIARKISQRDYFAGRPHLINRTGKLKRSEFVKTSRRGFRLKGEFGAKSIYARIHDYGGTIVPKTKPYLVFKIAGQWIRTKKVTIPKRPFLKPALRDAAKMFESFMKAKLEKTV